MYFKHLLQLLIFLTPFTIQSQNEVDLYRYSKTTHSGSARFEAMGGSFGALGADLSSSQINPAGYGRYSSSQVGLSVYGGRTMNQSVFNNTKTNDGNGMGGISNFAIVLTEDASEESRGYLYKQIGIGFNRIESYRNTIRYEGQQYSSLLDDFTSQAYGVEPQDLNTYFPFTTSVAYETYAINYDPGSQSYYSLLNSGDVYHNRTIESTGGQSELFFSYSANYMNKLYYGVNVGIRFYRYSENMTHREYLTDTTGTPMRGFEYKYDLSTNGTGANIKIGAIYLFSEAFRTGLAIHSPTFTELEDDWSADMSTEFEDSIMELHYDLVPTGNYKYKIRNPMKITASLAYVFDTRGCINLDIDAIDYRMAYFRSTGDNSYSPYSYDIENAYAKTVFQPALNLRLGGELIIRSMLYLRAGAAYYSQAFKKSVKVENSPDLIFSGGFGFKTKSLQGDIAYKYRTGSKNYYAFSNSFTKVNLITHQVIITAAYTF